MTALEGTSRAVYFSRKLRVGVVGGCGSLEPLYRNPAAAPQFSAITLTLGTPVRVVG